MKKIISVIFVIAFAFLFLNIQNAFSQSYDNAEFLIVNNTSNDEGFTIAVDVYPVGAVFNGDITGGYTGQYTHVAKYPGSENSYIYGIHNFDLSNQTNQRWYAKINFDKSQYVGDCHFSLGYGKYRIDFYVNSIKTFSCDVDFSDANYTGTSQTGYCQQFLIEYRNDGTVWAKFNDQNASYYQIGGSNSNTFAVWEQNGIYPAPPTIIPSKGNFSDSQDPASQFHSFPLDAKLFGHFEHITPEEVNLNLQIANYDANIISNSPLNINDCYFTVNDEKTFSINGGQQLLITGENGKFVSGNNSVINMTENSTIKIYNYSKIEATGTWFQSSSSSIRWAGIDLYYPGISFFDNCKFLNAINSIISYGNGSNCITIQNSLFENNYYYVLQIFKTNNLYIYNNVFNLGEFDGGIHNGIWILNQSFLEEENNLREQQFINIVKNEFNGGTRQLNTIGLASSLLPVNIERNTFNNGSANLILEGTTGTVYKNEIVSNLVCGNCISNIYINLGNPDLLENNVTGNYTSLYINNMSYPNLEPIIYEIQPIYWIAGKNKLTSTSLYNVCVDEWGDCFSKYGKNTFNITNNYSSMHFYGFLDTYLQYYYSYGNCWNINGNNANPYYSLHNRNYETIIIETGAPGLDCNWDEQIVDRIVTDKGNGIYDTILATQSNTISQTSSSDALYAMGVFNQKTKNYSIAINNFKNLINTYPDNKNIERAIFNLYACYVSSDTNHSQNWRDILFNDLKSFLENKIQQYQNNDEFVNVAFEFYIKCKINIKSYQPAMDGYDFIVNNSPSATERLMASINYIDVEGLLQGSGSGTQGDGELLDELNSDQNGKPIKDILLASYKKTKEQIKQSEKNDLKNSSDITATKDELSRKRTYEKKLESRAIENISISGSLTKSERRERIQKDLMLLHNRDGYTSKKTKSETTSPIKYELSQNYPNPFNPLTNIKYQIQKTGLVSLKIYDITGREIKTLVNEIKSPGSYMVSFNGSEFASGVYFYRIQAGDFVQVKKMILLK